MQRNLVFPLLLALASPVTANPLFRPIDTPEHTYAGGWEHFVGGGLAAFDCDGDALPELFAAGGSNTSILLRNRSTPDSVHFIEDTPDTL